MKWSDLPLPWQEAFIEGWLAGQAGSIPIGAVITDETGQIIARGRNHIHDTSPNPTDIGNHTLAHAELNAILSIRDPFIDFHHCTIYTTVEPCPMCLGAIYMAGIRTIRYASRDPYGGSTNLLGTTPYLSRKPVKAFGAGLGEENDLLFQTMIIALQTLDLLEKFIPERISGYINLLAEVSPQAVEAAYDIHQRNLLSPIKNNPMSAQEVFSVIAGFISRDRS